MYVYVLGSFHPRPLYMSSSYHAFLHLPLLRLSAVGVHVTVWRSFGLRLVGIRRFFVSWFTMTWSTFVRVALVSCTLVRFTLVYIALVHLCLAYRNSFVSCLDV